MQYVKLGSSGLKVSRLCFGTMTYGSKNWREWVLEEDESKPLFRRALEAGINFFDTADIYSMGLSEEITGRALKEFGVGRDKVVIATKASGEMGKDPNQRGLSRKHIFAQLTIVYDVSERTTSTSSRSIASTLKRLSKKRWTPWMI